MNQHRYYSSSNRDYSFAFYECECGYVFAHMLDFKLYYGSAALLLPTPAEAGIKIPEMFRKHQERPYDRP